MSATKTKSRKRSSKPYEVVTNKIIEQIESGIADGAFTSPWRLAAGAGLPHNAIGRRPYNGVNVLLLWAVAQIEEWPTNEWATYKQWKSADAQVRRGEESTTVVLFKTFRTAPREDEKPDGDDGKVKRIAIRLFSVFNAAQVDGWEPPVVPELDAAERDERLDAWVDATGAKITYNDGDRAAYFPGSDKITVPRFELFKRADLFHSTRFHELGHWTGAKSRLDRDLTTRFKSEKYAAEELVAELTSAFACGRFGLEAEPSPEHADYLASWLRLLRGDKKAIVTAASMGSKALTYLNDAALAGGWEE